MGFWDMKIMCHVSWLVIAPKANKALLRICCGYVEMNKYITKGHNYIPNVQYKLDKIINYHQIPLHLDIMEKLSVQTSRGQFKPIGCCRSMWERSSQILSILADDERIYSTYMLRILCVYSVYLYSFFLLCNCYIKLSEYKHQHLVNA